MLVDVIDQNSKKLRSVEILKDSDPKVNKALLYYGLRAFLNNLRHGTVKTKIRSEVNRTNKKIYRQKGTGGARHGPRSVNIFVGGGNVFGPLPRSYYERLPKKAKLASYREAFKHLAGIKGLKVLDALKLDKPSTKAARALLEKIGVEKALVVLPKADKNAELSFRNLKDVKVIHENNLNLIDLLHFDQVVMTSAFFDQVKERYTL